MAEATVSNEYLLVTNCPNQQVPIEYRQPCFVDGTKVQPVVHKVTSETLRLTEGRLLRLPLVGTAGPDGKKSSSFQITSVTVSSGASNDGEDDSCGEVEDSSEAGGSSRLTDYELFLDNGDGDSDLSVTSVGGVPVTVVQQSSGDGVHSKADDKDHGWQRRFRVVKIESAEPFKRGRWLCMDFQDQPAVLNNLSRDEPGSGASSSTSLSEHLPAEESHPCGLEQQQQQQVVPATMQQVFRLTGQKAPVQRCL